MEFNSGFKGLNHSYAIFEVAEAL